MGSPRRRPLLPFVLASAIVWLVMTAILVIVPDVLAGWMPVEVARVIGWAVACSVWVIAVERQWQERVGPLMRFALQLGLWVAAALAAIWISEQAKF